MMKDGFKTTVQLTSKLHVKTVEKGPPSPTEGVLPIHLLKSYSIFLSHLLQGSMLDGRNSSFTPKGSGNFFKEKNFALEVLQESMQESNVLNFLHLVLPIYMGRNNYPAHDFRPVSRWML